MNDIIKSKLEILSQDELMIRAIVELFNERIEKEKPLISDDNGDKILGQKYRAYTQCMSLLEKFLLDLETYKNEKSNSKGFNKGK